jgi:mRNA export factor
VFKALSSHDSPILCSAWSGDGTQVFTGGCDNMVKCWSLASGVSHRCGQHDAPVKVMNYSTEMSLLCTGSWDKTLKYWDLRQQIPAAVLPMPERVYCMDVVYPISIVCTADRHVLIYDLRRPNVEYKRLTSPLKYQSRCVALFPDKTGYALGSIEGRVAIHHVEDKDQSKNFAFKCHRDGNSIFAVNSISFHPTYGTFATSGSDGTFHFWDKDSKQRLQRFQKMPLPIPAISFNMDGTLFAYAGCYDWSKGSEFYDPQGKVNLFVHVTPAEQIRNRHR